MVGMTWYYKMGTYPKLELKTQWQRVQDEQVSESSWDHYENGSMIAEPTSYLGHRVILADMASLVLVGFEGKSWQGPVALFLGSDAGGGRWSRTGKGVADKVGGRHAAGSSRRVRRQGPQRDGGAAGKVFVLLGGAIPPLTGGWTSDGAFDDDRVVRGSRCTSNSRTPCRVSWGCSRSP